MALLRRRRMEKERHHEDCCLPGVKKIEKQVGGIEFNRNRLIRALEPLKKIKVV